MTPDPTDNGTGTATGPRRRSRSRIWMSALGVSLVALLLIVGVPLASPLFPAETIMSCTIEEHGFTGRRGNLVPKQRSDCGAFTSRGRVECTSNPDREIALIPGNTYDLVVRGPRLAPIARPVIVSATVATEQKFPHPDYGFDDAPSDIPAVRELQEQFATETLRAYDYEQPPFDPECEVGRSVMTSIGIQYVNPARAEHLLTPPAGAVPADPKLPCEGFQCSVPTAGPS